MSMITEQSRVQLYNVRNVGKYLDSQPTAVLACITLIARYLLALQSRCAALLCSTLYHTILHKPNLNLNSLSSSYSCLTLASPPRYHLLYHFLLLFSVPLSSSHPPPPLPPADPDSNIH